MTDVRLVDVRVNVRDALRDIQRLNREMREMATQAERTNRRMKSVNDGLNGSLAITIRNLRAVVGLLQQEALLLTQRAALYGGQTAVAALGAVPQGRAVPSPVTGGVSAIAGAATGAAYARAQDGVARSRASVSPSAPGGGWAFVQPRKRAAGPVWHKVGPTSPTGAAPSAWGQARTDVEYGARRLAEGRRNALQLFGGGGLFAGLTGAFTIGAGLSANVTTDDVLYRLGTVSGRSPGSNRQQFVGNQLAEGIQFGARHGLSRREFLNTQYSLISGGIAPEDSATFTREIAKVARITGGDPTVVGSTFTTLANNFAGVTPTQLAGLLTAGQLQFQIENFGQLAYGLAYGAGAGAGTGIPIEQVISGLGRLNSLGFQGSQAGTYFRGLVAKLIDPKTAAKLNKADPSGLQYEVIRTPQGGVDYAATVDLLSRVVRERKANDIGFDSQIGAIFGRQISSPVLALASETNVGVSQKDSEQLNDIAFGGVGVVERETGASLDSLATKTRGFGQSVSAAFESFTGSLGTIVAEVSDFVFDLEKLSNNLADYAAGYELRSANIAGSSQAFALKLATEQNLRAVGTALGAGGAGAQVNEETLQYVNDPANKGRVIAIARALYAIDPKGYEALHSNVKYFNVEGEVGAEADAEVNDYIAARFGNAVPDNSYVSYHQTPELAAILKTVPLPKPLVVTKGGKPEPTEDVNGFLNERLRLLDQLHAASAARRITGVRSLLSRKQTPLTDADINKALGNEDFINELLADGDLLTRNDLYLPTDPVARQDPTLIGQVRDSSLHRVRERIKAGDNASIQTQRISTELRRIRSRPRSLNPQDELRRVQRINELTQDLRPFLRITQGAQYVEPPLLDTTPYEDAIEFAPTGVGAEADIRNATRQRLHRLRVQERADFARPHSSRRLITLSELYDEERSRLLRVQDAQIAELNTSPIDQLFRAQGLQDLEIEGVSPAAIQRIGAAAAQRATFEGRDPHTAYREAIEGLSEEDIASLRGRTTRERLRSLSDQTLPVQIRDTRQLLAAAKEDENLVGREEIIKRLTETLDNLNREGDDTDSFFRGMRDRLAELEEEGERFNEQFGRNIINSLDDLNKVLADGTAQWLTYGGTFRNVLDSVRDYSLNTLYQFQSQIFDSLLDKTIEGLTGHKGGLGGIGESLISIGANALFPGSGGVAGATDPGTTAILPGTGYARGGVVRGPGSSTSDSVPALLSNGEFIVNAAATRRNRRLLENINAQRYEMGGFVDADYSPYAPDASAAGSGVTVNVTVESPNRSTGGRGGGALETERSAEVFGETIAQSVRSIIATESRPSGQIGRNFVRRG